MLDKVKEFVNKAYGKNPIHFERAVYWLQQINPNADEPMLIAAYAHDVERAFSPVTIDYFKDRELDDQEYLMLHQEEGARIISEFLYLQGYPEEEISRIEHMVRLHEAGGMPEAEWIKDADSISYFEVNAPKHIEKFGKPLGKAKVRRKYDFMFERMTHPEARKIAFPMYRKVMDLLEQSE